MSRRASHYVAGSHNEQTACGRYAPTYGDHPGASLQRTSDTAAVTCRACLAAMGQPVVTRTRSRPDATR